MAHTGKNIKEGSVSIDDIKLKGTMSNVEVCQWYLDKEATIKNTIDISKPLSEEAKQAFDLRNHFRTQTRELMQDRSLI